MSWCKFCGQEIDWLSTLEGRPVAVDPDPVFVIEEDGQETLFGGAKPARSETFLDDRGITLFGRQARPEEERPELPTAFVPHRRTCPWANRSAPRRIEYNTDAGGLAPAT